MRRIVLLVVPLGILSVLVGCAPGTSSVSHGTTPRARFYGDAGITGHNNVVTIDKWSRINKLSILGNANDVIVEDGVRVPLIEVWGSDNTISIPHGMIVQFRQVGSRNRLVERAPRVGEMPPATAMPIEELPPVPVYTPPPAPEFTPVDPLQPVWPPMDEELPPPPPPVDEPDPTLK